MIKKMEKGKTMMRQVDYYMKENIKKESNGMEKNIYIMIMNN